MCRTAWLCAACALALGAPLAAQEGHMTVAPGARVRVTTQSLAGRERLEGVYLSSTPDSLFIDPVGAQERRGLPRPSVVAIEGWAGTKGRAGRGALIGGAIGLGAGVVVGAVCLAEAEDLDIPDAGCAVPLLGAVPLGAGIGALIGSGSTTDRWEPAALSTASVAPLVWRGGVGLAVRIAF